MSREPVWTSRGEPQTPKLPCAKCANLVRLRVVAKDGESVCMRCWTQEAGEGRFPTKVPGP